MDVVGPRTLSGAGADCVEPEKAFVRCLRWRDGESRRRSDRFLYGSRIAAPDIGVIVQVGERMLTHLLLREEMSS